jgi:3-oxoacyl-[acyl-carrier-protein] synthase II
MRDVVITGVGAVTALAGNASGLLVALRAGERGSKPIELFSTAGLPVTTGGEIRPFEPSEVLGDRNLRPVDRTGRLLLVAVHEALADSAWDADRRTAHETGLALGTNFCSLRTIAEFDRRAVERGPAAASPIDFANCVINAAAGQAAIWFGLRGASSTHAAGEASGLAALADAAHQIRSGRADAMLAAGAEELCHESFLGYVRAGRLGQRPVPFDRHRDGFALGEGAAVLMLEEASAAAARGARRLGVVRGHGAACDPSGGADPQLAADAVARAVATALVAAGVEPRELELLVLGANGSVAGDRAEALGIACALGPLAAELPLTAPKAMTGELLGASGIIQVLTALGAFADGGVPGIVDLAAVHDDFPLGGPSATTRWLAAPPRLALLTALSADGQATAAVLAAPTP